MEFSTPDPSSYSNFLDAHVKHVDFVVLRINFDSRTLSGKAQYTYRVHTAGTTHIVLDSRDIEITSVTDDVAGKNDIVWTFGESDDTRGSAILVEIPEEHREEGYEGTFVIEFQTAPTSSSIGWLTPEQTAGKVHPYMFTQNQAIHARSMFPCQDAPGAKFTYAAAVTVQKPLTALMSANRVGEPEEAEDTRTFRFDQPVPISAYLVALAAGELESRKIGPRTHVWSEPSVVDKAAEEFDVTEKYLQAGEKLLGPYVWGQYDLLTLPPSFPYGGMENPCLTFVTPTLLAGDKSLVDVVAHEIGHSWTGNLVTNRTWSDFWLNEGFTMMVERKITAAVHGEEVFGFKAQRGQIHLADDVELFMKNGNPQYTKLVPDLEGVDPDDVFSSVPYEKGFALLYFIQSQVGSEKFDQFLHDYIDNFKFKTLTSEDFKAFTTNYFEEKGSPIEVNWDSWFNEPGMPPVELKFDQTLQKEVEALLKIWLDPAATLPAHSLSKFNSGQIQFFLDSLTTYLSSQQSNNSRAVLDHQLLQKLDEQYNFSKTGNAEIAFLWQRLCLRSGYEPITPYALNMLKTQGRMKFTRPLYREMMNTPFGREEAMQLFETMKGAYHPICSKMVAADIENALKEEPRSFEGSEPVGGPGPSIAPADQATAVAEKDDGDDALLDELLEENFRSNASEEKEDSADAGNSNDVDGEEDDEEDDYEPANDLDEVKPYVRQSSETIESSAAAEKSSSPKATSSKPSAIVSPTATQTISRQTKRMGPTRRVKRSLVHSTPAQLAITGVIAGSVGLVSYYLLKHFLR